jgi:hypothetical protein
MAPLFINQYEREQYPAIPFYDPYARPQFSRPEQPYRSDLSVIEDLLQRQHNVFVDLPQLVKKPQPTPLASLPTPQR